jgi:hypothetical protein
VHWCRCPAGIVSTGPSTKRRRNSGDADLLRPIARLLRRSQRCAIVARACHGNIRRRWLVGCGGEQVAKVRGATKLSGAIPA